MHRQDDDRTGLAGLGSVGLAAAVAHEVRRILTPARARAEAAISSPGLPSDASQALNSILAAAGCVEAMLMLLVKSQNAQTVNVHEACAQVARGDAQVHIRGDPHLLVSVPEAALIAILMNLIENAKRAAPVGSLIEVSFDTSSTGNTATIRVEDKGCGVRTDNAFRLFDRRAQGFGIGLPLCRALTEEFGGSIEVLPRPGGGTSAIVQFPLAQSLATKAAA